MTYVATQKREVQKTGDSGERLEAKYAELQSSTVVRAEYGSDDDGKLIATTQVDEK